VRFFDRARFEQICPGKAPSEVRRQIDEIGRPRQELWKAEVTSARVLEAVDQYAQLALLYYALGCESNVRSCHRIMTGLVRQYLPGEAWGLYLRSVGRKNPLPDARMQVELTLQVGTQEVQDSTVTECDGVSLATLRATGLDVSVSSSAAFPLTKVAVLRGPRWILELTLVRLFRFYSLQTRDFLMAELA
jgi:hypothetical protein